MKASIPSKKFTAAKQVSHFLYASALIFAFSTAVQANELGNGNAAKSKYEVDKNSCDTVRSTMRDIQKDFDKACATARLGSRTSCRNKLEDCEKSSAKDDPKCLNHATSTDEHKDLVATNKERLESSQDREEKIEDKIKDAQADIIEARNEMAEVDVEISEQQQELEKIINETAAGRAEAMNAKNLEMRRISDSVRQTNDKIAELSLEMQSFVLENEVKCRETALEAKNTYVSREREKAARNRQGKIIVSTTDLYNRANLSVNQLGSREYDRVLKSCTSLYNARGRKTGFGSAYIVKHRQLSHQKNILKRQIARLEQSRSDVLAAMRLTMQQLDAQERLALSTAQKQLVNLNRKKQIIAAKMNASMFALPGLFNARRAALNESHEARGKLSETYASANGSSKTAPQSAIEAFFTAQGLLESVKGANDDYEDQAISCGFKNETDKIQASVEEDKLNISLDDGSVEDQDINALAVAVADTTASTTTTTTRRSAASTTANRGLKVNGQTISR